jgi:septal ring factor EnvC (AmiA/AmiB activator)
MAVEGVPSRRLSGTVVGVIVGAAAGLLGVAAIAFGVNRAATQREVQLGERTEQREAQLGDRLAKAEERIQQLSASFAQGETRIQQLSASSAQGEARLRKAESAVSVQKTKEAALEAERQELAASPTKYIQTVSVVIYNRGIINSYSKATAATLTNRSHFNLSDLRGTVEYRGADGSLVGSAPVEIQGPLLAGQTAARNLSAGEVTGSSSSEQSQIVVQRATILEGGN